MDKSDWFWVGLITVVGVAGAYVIGTAYQILKIITDLFGRGIWS